MSLLPLLYGNVVPLNRSAHSLSRIEGGPRRFGFAGSTHLLPAVIDEFAVASRHLPIVFLPGDDAPTPVFLLGIRSGSNVFVDKDGRWLAGYLPSYIRRYPFMLGEVADREPLLCADETALQADGPECVPLFEGGAETAVLREMIDLTTAYFEAARRTAAAMATLQKLKLFKSVTIDVAAENNSTSSMTGIKVVDEDKLNELPGEQIAHLHASRLLGPIYAHLISLEGVKQLAEAGPA